MGNQNKKIVLQSTQRLIVIDDQQKKTLTLNELPVFPHGYDGLHIWEAGIVLARYILYNSEQFAGKRILELGAGVGIGGLSALKFTNCKQCVMSDYVPEILENIKTNVMKNKVSQNVSIIQLNWLEYEKTSFAQKFDIIIGSDIVYFGCPVVELYNMIKKALANDGIAQILIPDRKNYAQLFLQQIQANVFDVFMKKLQDPGYRQSPLPNKVQVDIDFYMYTLVRKNKNIQSSEQKQKQTKTEQKGQQQIKQPETNKSLVSAQQTTKITKEPQQLKIQKSEDDMNKIYQQQIKQQPIVIVDIEIKQPKQVKVDNEPVSNLQSEQKKQKMQQQKTSQIQISEQKQDNVHVVVQQQNQVITLNSKQVQTNKIIPKSQQTQIKQQPKQEQVQENINVNLENTQINQQSVENKEQETNVNQQLQVKQTNNQIDQDKNTIQQTNNQQGSQNQQLQQQTTEKQENVEEPSKGQGKKKKKNKKKKKAQGDEQQEDQKQ